MAGQDFGAELAALRAKNGGRPVAVGGGMGKQPKPPAPTGPTRGIGADLAIGAGKGALNTAVNLGELARKVPGLGDGLDALSKYAFDVDPNAAFAQTQNDLKPTSGAQSFGKGAEQVAEFFLPGAQESVGSKLMTLPMATRGALIKRLAGMIPNNVSPEVAAMLNKLAAVTGRVGGEAASAGAVSAAHGADEGEMERTAAMAGAGPLIGLGGKMTAEAMANLAKTPYGRQLIPLLSAIGITKAIPSFTGLGAAMGTFGLARQASRNFLNKQRLNPRMVSAIGDTVRGGIEAGSRFMAGASDTLIPRRRRLEAQ